MPLYLLPLVARHRLASVWWLLLAACSIASAQQQAAPFGFEDVARDARALAGQPWRKPPPPDPKRVGLEYDEFRRIQFRAEHALWRGRGLPFEMHFFPVGRGMTRALHLFEVNEGRARPVALPAAAFNLDGVLPPEPAGRSPAVSGWRLTYPLNQPGKRDEVLAFQGSSYFRALGMGQRYGLSARGLGLDTVGGQGEEFPEFVAFWFETPSRDAREFSFYALLDGPRVTGAYQFVLKPGRNTVVEVRARLFLRGPVATLGIAPLTSMFLHGENQAAATADFRPEVHDSDGLQIETADGEWIWRPLTNPRQIFVSSFALRSPRGFGLMQRDRTFTSYEDVEARYEMRPSAWVEPVGDWGAGRVELLQFRTPDETHDNVVAYWVPAQAPAAGTPLELAWRVHWQGEAQRLPPSGHVLQTRTGPGYTKLPQPPGRLQFYVDFVGPGLPPEDALDVKAVASGNANVRIVRAHVYPNPVRRGWRATVEIDRLDKQQAAELRVFLRQGSNTLSETWSYALAPE